MSRRPTSDLALHTVEHGLTLHKYWSSACPRCPIKAQCTTRATIGASRVGSTKHVLDAMQRRLDRTPQASRMRRQTVEHPFGTLKAWMGATHFLTKTLPRVSTEMSLHVLGLQPETRDADPRSAAPDRGNGEINSALLDHQSQPSIIEAVTATVIPTARSSLSVGFLHGLGRDATVAEWAFYRGALTMALRHGPNQLLRNARPKRKPKPAAISNDAAGWRFTTPTRSCRISAASCDTK